MKLAFTWASWRRLRSEPLLVSTVVPSLALGVGINTVIFSLLYSLFIHPVPAVKKPNEVVLIHGRGAAEGITLPVSLPNFKDLRQRVRSLFAISAVHTVWTAVGRGEGAAQVTGELVTPDYFPLLGPAMVLGRPLSRAASDGDRPNEVVVSHSFWRRRLGSDPAAAGSTVWLNGHPFRVVGVAEPGFHGTNALNGVQFWALLSERDTLSSYPELFAQRSGMVLQVLGRLHDGATEHTLRHELRELSAQLSREHPDELRDLELDCVPVALATISADRRPAYLRFGVILASLALLVLAVAGVNSAVLLLASVSRRSMELSLRLSLGATKASLLRQLLGELAPLMILAFLISLSIAWVLWRTLWLLRPPFIGEEALSLGLRFPELSIALVATVLVSLIVACGPVIALSQDKLSLALSGGARALHSLGRLRLSRIDTLMTMQVAVSFVGLLGALLLASSLYQAQSADLGFDTDALAILSMDFGATSYDEQQGRAVQQGILARVRALSTVEAATLGEGRPLGGFRLLREIWRIGQDGPEQERPLVGSLVVDDHYFNTLRIPILAGRAFTEADDRRSTRVAIVNERLSELLWREESPVGALVFVDDDPSPVSIVGVARNCKHISPLEEALPALYLPANQHYISRISLLVRLRRPPSRELVALKREILAVAPDALVVEARPGSSLVRQALWGPRMSAGLAALFAIVALALAGVGLNAISYEVISSRLREIGVRLSIGETYIGLVGLLLRHSLLVVVLGLALGLLPGLLLQLQMQAGMAGGVVTFWAASSAAAATLIVLAVLCSARFYLTFARLTPVHLLRQT